MGTVEEVEARTIAKMVMKIKVEGSPPAMTVVEGFALEAEDSGLEVVMDRDGVAVLAPPMIRTTTSRTMMIHLLIQTAKNEAVLVRVVAGEVASAHVVETGIRVGLAAAVAEEVKIKMNRRTKMAEVGYNN